MIKQKSTKSLTNFSKTDNSKRNTPSSLKKASNSNQHQNDIVLNVSAAFGANALKGKLIDFKVKIKCTNETFNVIKFPISMKIRDLKSCLEFICGIPFDLQRLSYLDDGELIDSKEIQYYDVIDGALIMMDIWTIYVGLVQASAYGNINDVLKQGVSTNVEWTSATSDYMFAKDKTKYIQTRSGIALFIASHRGNLALVKGLLANGASLNYKSSYGRTSLMVSVVANKTHIIDYLLENNADIDIIDINGDNALSIAKKFNNKLGQHRLTQFKWKKRTEAEMKLKKGLKKDDNDDIFPENRYAHQIFDSHKKTWFKGNYMQVYMMQLVPQKEFSGSGLSAPKSVGKQVLKEHRKSRSMSELKMTKSLDEQSDNENDATSPIQHGLTFDKWLAQKMKLKRLEMQKLKKAEADKDNENKDEISKESYSLLSTEPDNNLWMKDYTKPNMISAKLDFFEQNKRGIQNSNNNSNIFTNASSLNFNSASVGSFQNSNRNSSKNINFLNIYKGMSYEEWTKIRDSFLKTHNMI